MSSLMDVNIFNVFSKRIARLPIPAYRKPRSKHTFTEHEHLCILVFQMITKVPLCTLEMLALLLLGKHLDHSTPSKAKRRFGMKLFLQVLKVCLPILRGKICAVNSTGFSLSRKSAYYAYKFFRSNPGDFAKVSFLADTRTTAILAVQVHVLPRHDIRDIKKLLAHTRGAKHFVADKAYDAEWLHEMLEELGITPHIHTTYSRAQIEY